MKHPKLVRIVAGLLASLLMMTGIAFASNYGTSSDPLVTLSYITSVFQPALLQEIDARIAAAKTELANQLEQDAANLGLSGGTAEFEVVSLSEGQRLIGEVGTEIMLRIGSAACVASSAPGLIDTTGGTTLSGGSSLQQNHLYMVTVEERGLRATSDVKVIVRGAYTVS